MPYSKRQIVEVPFVLNGKIELHPAIILSVQDVFELDEFYICVMISDTDNYNDKFSYKLEEDATTKGLTKGSCVRTHLITPVRESEIVSGTKRNFIKEENFGYLVDHIAEVVFGAPFTY
tara:strand:+ start:7462 stop:7818 length:357 start_codon:yes stop_codon:yes gene_type:complete